MHVITSRLCQKKVGVDLGKITLWVKVGILLWLLVSWKDLEVDKAKIEVIENPSHPISLRELWGFEGKYKILAKVYIRIFKSLKTIDCPSKRTIRTYRWRWRLVNIINIEESFIRSPHFRNSSVGLTFLDCVGCLKFCNWSDKKWWP